MVAEQRGYTPWMGAGPNDRERISELSIEERDLLSVAHKNAVGSRRAAWRIGTSVEQKDKTEGHEQQPASARAFVIEVEDELQKVRDGILVFTAKSLIPSVSTGESN